MPTSPLIVEDGSCVEDANTYVAWADFLVFLGDQWNADQALVEAQALTVDAQNQLLMASARALACYAWCGVGCRTAGLAWPRIVCGDLMLPPAIKRAQMLIAQRLLTSGGTANSGVLVKSLNLPGGLSVSFGGEGANIALSADGCMSEISSAETQSDELACLIQPLLARARRVAQRGLLCA